MNTAIILHEGFEHPLPPPHFGLLKGVGHREHLPWVLGDNFTSRASWGGWKVVPSSAPARIAQHPAEGAPRQFRDASSKARDPADCSKVEIQKNDSHIQTASSNPPGSPAGQVHTYIV